ncbi:SDR family NAD(P)-dependent oxidoreductase [Nonomuraea sp. NPDC050786]|uniref:SDR family NAD(P)-dependent oxidoreductase n=1 Tax=Nonomuraea sp. NPDC050786 TaxID=3154840 RepID=UPI0033C930F0
MKIGAAAPALLVVTSAVIRTATRLPVRFTVTMLCDPGKPMLVLGDDEELAQFKNNAGVMLNGPIVGADITQWTRMVETNLLGSMYMVHAGLPHLLERRGTIVQVSSTSGWIASAYAGVYAATKFGITAFSESLRQEVTTRGVRVVVIEPGFVATELTGHNTDPTMRAAAQNMAASMRTLQPQDIADAVVYAVTQPEHVAVNEILIRPTDQTQ